MFSTTLCPFQSSKRSKFKCSQSNRRWHTSRNTVQRHQASSYTTTRVTSVASTLLTSEGCRPLQAGQERELPASTTCTHTRHRAVSLSLRPRASMGGLGDLRSPSIRRVSPNCLSSRQWARTSTMATQDHFHCKGTSRAAAYPLTTARRRSLSCRRLSRTARARMMGQSKTRESSSRTPSTASCRASRPRRRPSWASPWV